MFIMLSVSFKDVGRQASNLPLLLVLLLSLASYILTPTPYLAGINVSSLSN